MLLDKFEEIINNLKGSQLHIVQTALEQLKEAENMIQTWDENGYSGGGETLKQLRFQPNIIYNMVVDLNDFLKEKSRQYGEITRKIGQLHHETELINIRINTLKNIISLKQIRVRKTRKKKGNNIGGKHKRKRTRSAKK